MALVPNQILSKLEQQFVLGCKPFAQWRLGMEREHLVLLKAGMKPIPFTGPVSVSSLLDELQERFQWHSEASTDTTLALKRGEARITLEPAGQIEWSGSPLKSVAAIAEEFQNWQQELKQLKVMPELLWLSSGINPIYRPEEMHWIPKERYRLMKEVLPKRGPLALLMMSLTTSTQVSIDYATETDCAEKFRLAASLVPLFTALYANSPIYAGQKSGTISYRSHIWTKTDPTRSGIQPFFLSENTHIFSAYIDYALKVPMFFTVEPGTKNDCCLKDANSQTFLQYLQERGDHWSMDDWLAHLTTIFTEVRLKNYIEVRTPDGNFLPLALSFPALCRALLYHAEARREVWQITRRFGFTEQLDARASAAALGLSGSTWGRYRMLDLAKQIYEIAAQALKDLDQTQDTHDQPYLDPLGQQILEKRCSPGEELLKLWDGKWHGNKLALIEYLSQS